MDNEKIKIEENIRMGKARDLFKRTGDTKRIFHIKTGIIKDRKKKKKKLEDIKRRQEYKEELHRKDLQDQITMMV